MYRARKPGTTWISVRKNCQCEQEDNTEKEAHKDNDEDSTETEDEEEVRQFNEEDYEGFVFMQMDVISKLQDKEGIPLSWILLHSQLTVDVFCNGKVLSSIHEVKDTWSCIVMPELSM